MDDGLDPVERGFQRVGPEVEAVEREPRPVEQPGEVALLDRRGVVVGEGVEPDDVVALGQEPLADVRADEAGNAGDKDAHGRQAYRTTLMSFQSSAMLRPPVGVWRQVRSSGFGDGSRHGDGETRQDATARGGREPPVVGPAREMDDDDRSVPDAGPDRDLGPRLELPAEVGEVAVLAEPDAGGLDAGAANLGDHRVRRAGIARQPDLDLDPDIARRGRREILAGTDIAAHRLGDHPRALVRLGRQTDDREGLGWIVGPELPADVRAGADDPRIEVVLERELGPGLGPGGRQRAGGDPKAEVHHTVDVAAARRVPGQHDESGGRAHWIAAGRAAAGLGRGRIGDERPPRPTSWVEAARGRTTSSAVHQVLKHDAGDAQGLLRRLMDALALPGAELLTPADQPRGHVVTPTPAAVARFESRMAEQAQHRAELEEELMAHVVVFDYGSGNVRSAVRALEHVGAEGHPHR